MAAAGGQLAFTFMADTSSFNAGIQQAQQALQQFSQVKEGTNQNLIMLGNSFNQASDGANQMQQSTQAAGVGLGNVASGMSMVGGIGRQLIGMYTSYNVWQIRLVQYEQQLRDAEARRVAEEREVMYTDQQLGQVTYQMAGILQNLAQTTVQLPNTFNDLRRSTGDLITAIGRFGPQSYEAAQATSQWEQAMMSWGEKAREIGAPLDKINEVMTILQQSIQEGQIPNWQQLGEEVGWNTQQWGPLGTYAMNASSIISDAQQQMQNDFVNTATDQQRLSKAQADYGSQVMLTDYSIQEATQKVADAQNEAKLQVISFGLETAGLVGQVIMLVGQLGILKTAWMNVGTSAATAATEEETAGQVPITSYMTPTAVPAAAATPAEGAAAQAPSAGGGVVATIAGALSSIMSVTLVPWTQQMSNWFGQLVSGKKPSPFGIAAPAGQFGISDVPTTGMYYLHQHEKVSPAGAQDFIEELTRVMKQALSASQELPMGVVSQYPRIAQFGVADAEAGMYYMHAGETLSAAGAEAAMKELTATMKQVMVPSSISTMTSRAVASALGQTKAAGPTTNNNFGDIVIQVQQLTKDQDMRTVALKLRRYIQAERVRTPG